MATEFTIVWTLTQITRSSDVLPCAQLGRYVCQTFHHLETTCRRTLSIWDRYCNVRGRQLRCQSSRRIGVILGDYQASTRPCLQSVANQTVGLVLPETLTVLSLGVIKFERDGRDGSV